MATPKGSGSNEFPPSHGPHGDLCEHCVKVRDAKIAEAYRRAAEHPAACICQVCEWVRNRENAAAEAAHDTTLSILNDDVASLRREKTGKLTTAQRVNDDLEAARARAKAKFESLGSQPQSER